MVRRAMARNLRFCHPEPYYGLMPADRIGWGEVQRRVESCVRSTAIAGCFVYVAFLWTLLLQQWFSYPFLYLFLAAVMGSAWLGGAVAGFVAVILSTVVVRYFFLPPFFSFALNTAAQTYFISFIVCASAVSWVSSAKKKTETASREARDLLEQRVRERTAELERSNREIQERERQLRELTEAIPQQIWSASPAGVIEYCNQHLLDYVGRTGNDMRGDRFLDVLHPEDCDLFSREWKSVLASGSPLEGEWRIRGADGNYRWFLVRSISQRSEEGRVIRWYGTHIDIEERHRAERALKETQSELAHLSRVLSMGELTASIAHEVNQPLTAVVTHAYACLSWLRATPANLPRAVTTAERIVQEASRASTVVARVRALFRREPEHKQLLDINAVIRDLVNLLREEAIRRGAFLRTELEPDLPLVEGDRVQLQQVLFNLAVNGMDAMAEVTNRRRELIISSGRDATGEILVRVEDCGVGLSPEIAGRIFEPFFTTKRDGLGVGLAITRSIVEAHDGRIWATARQPAGATFQFTIPVQS